MRECRLKISQFKNEMRMPRNEKSKLCFVTLCSVPICVELRISNGFTANIPPIISIYLSIQILLYKLITTAPADMVDVEKYNRYV